MVQALDESVYRVLFDANPQPMWVFERETLRFLAVNDAALRQYGYTREEFLSLTILDIRPEEDAGFVRDSVGSEAGVSRIWRHRRRDGSTLLAEVSAHPLPFDGIEARLVLALDVTLRERQAELLRQSNRTLEAVLETAPVGIVVFDSKGRVTHRNETADRLLGATGDLPIRSLYDSIVRGETYAWNESRTEQGGWFEAAARPLELGPGANGAIVVLSEVTEHHTARGRLVRDLESRTRALNASDAEVEGLCFSLSHDLRGPLRAIDGFSQLVLTDPQAALTGEHRDALARIRKAAKRMDVLIDGILALSRLSRIPLDPCELDLSEMVRRSAETLKRAEPNRSLKFVIEPDLTACGDPRLVTLLIDVLLGNAVKFSLGREPATIEFYAEGSGWAVRDDGAGFDMAYASHLFRPFERLHRPGEYAGDGLGLAVAQRVVSRHGGEIEGHGALEEGACFRFTLGSEVNGNF